MALKVVSEAKKKEPVKAVAKKEPAVKAVPKAKVDKHADPKKAAPAGLGGDGRQLLGDRLRRSGRGLCGVREAAEAVATKVVKEAKVVEGKAVAMKKGDTSLLGETREAYRNFQFSWFQFAKKVKVVQDTDEWEKAGYENFKEYCLDEFPDVAYTTILKFIKVADSMGQALDQRLIKSPADGLPAFTTCYDFLTHQDRIPKDEVPKIRKAIIEGKLTRHEMMEKVEPFIQKGHAKDDKRRADEAKKIDAAVAGDAKPKAAASKVVPIKPEPAAKADDVLDVDGDLATDVDKQVLQLLERVKYLNDNLPIVTAAVTVQSVAVVTLAEALEKLTEHSDKYLDQASAASAG
jgi:hypothetical protein